ncbi:hypothetical protein IAT38_007606 [Cryptococcus sp. DSM 104549]
MDPIQEEKSLPGGQVILGIPVSPGFGGEMREEYEHVAEESALDDGDGDLAHDGQPSTPKARNSVSLRTPQTPRALFFQPTASGMSTPASPIHRPSFSSFDHSAFPSPPSASPGTRSPRSSMTSFHPSMSPPLSPTSPGEHRSRVSLDATPLMPPMELAPSPPRGDEEEIEHDEDEGTIHGSPTLSVHTLRHPPRSVSAPVLDETPAEPSFNFSFPRDTMRSASAEEPAGKAVDETIRSAEGVVGLGEGWSGGPRPRPSRLSWFSRRKTVNTADPLTLWNEGGDGAGVTRSMSASPLKQLWNRSKRNLFGESCPSLHEQRPITPVHAATRVHLSSPGERRRWSTLRPDATPSPPDSDPFRRHEPGITSSHSQPIPTTRPFPSTSSFSPSSPHLPLRPNSQPDLSYSKSAFARSEGDLHSLGGQRGLPPPWRPRSMLIAGRQLSFAHDIPELDEDRPGASRAGTPTSKPRREVSPHASEHSNRSGGSAAAVLTPIVRTETFGDGSSGEDDHGSGGSGEEHELEGAQEKTGRGKLEQSRGEKSGVRPASPPLRSRTTVPREKRASLFHRMKAMLFHRREAPEASKTRAETPSKTRSETPAPARPGLGRRRTFRQALYRRSRATLLGSPSTSALASGADVEGSHDEEPQSPFPRCRSPWLALQSSALAKRFSMFGEHREHSHPHEHEQENDHEDETEDTHSTHTRRSHSPRSSHHTERTQRRHSISHTSTHSILSQRTISIESASDHLVRLSTADLNLDVHLEGAGLGLDDIIDESKRSSYVTAMYTRGAMSLDDLTLLGRAETPSLSTIGLGISGWRGPQQRKDSTPRASISGQGTTGRGGSWQACYAKSYDALVLGQPISATPFTPEPMAEQRYSGGSEAHSPVSTLALMTPAMQTPRELGMTLDSFTVLELEESGEETGARERHLGLGMSGTMDELVKKEGDPRISVTSYGGSYQSLDDEENVHAVEQQAIRVDSLVDMRRKASMISSADVPGRRRWGGLVV